ncbi:MAG TPA: hypothetical protein VES42_10990 [Pilimelia sp.]|nr:hypothetical protein [Pilimelia sp.]
MTSVRLLLPQEIIDGLDLPYEGLRDAGAVVEVAVQAVGVTASVITLDTLRPRAKAFAGAIRRWRLRQPPRPAVTLTVKGPGIDLTLQLPPNVDSADILRRLGPLLDDGP